MKTGDLFCFAFTAGPIIAGSGSDDEEKFVDKIFLAEFCKRIPETRCTDKGKSQNQESTM